MQNKWIQWDMQKQQLAPSNLLCFGFEFVIVTSPRQLGFVLAACSIFSKRGCLVLYDNQRYANQKQAEMLDVHHGCFLFSLLRFLRRSVGLLWFHSTLEAATARQPHPPGNGTVSIGKHACNECSSPKRAVPNWTEPYLVLSGNVAIVTWQLPVNEQSLENKMDKMALRLPTVLDKPLSKYNILVHIRTCVWK